jgi:hypothetical protein
MICQTDPRLTDSKRAVRSFLKPQTTPDRVQATGTIRKLPPKTKSPRAFQGGAASLIDLPKARTRPGIPFPRISGPH